MCASYAARWRARGDHSTRTTPRQPLRSFYIAERAARSRAFLAVFAPVFPLSLASHSRRVQLSLSLCAISQPALVTAGALLSSLPVLCSRLCRCSASALRLCLCSASAQPHLCRASVSSLLCLRLASASASPSLIAYTVYGFSM